MFPTSGFNDRVAMPQMDEITLRNVLKDRESSALGSEDSTLSQDRQAALGRYRGDPLGDEEDGKSKIVMTDTQDVIESVLPSILRIFFSGSAIVEFQPEKESDEDGAKQATDYMSFVFTSDNDGFLAAYTAIKDALMLRTGLIKTWWEEDEEVVTEESEGIDSDQLTILADDPDIEIIEQTQRIVNGGIAEVELDPLSGQPINLDPITGLPLGAEVVFDVKYKRTKNLGGRLKLEALPNEEFGIEASAKSMADATYAVHVTNKTESDLIAQLDSFDGVTKKDIQNLPTSSGDLLRSAETIQRFQPDNSATLDTSDTADRTTRLIRVMEHYIKIDFDGDGIAEWRIITGLGNTNEIIAQNKELPTGIPVVDFTPIIMPHKFVGRSLDDLTKDVTEINTAIIRQVLNNFYQSNYPQRIVDPNKISVDDCLSPAPNGVIQGDPSGYLQLPPTTLGSSPFNLLEFIQTIKENRTGITRANQGLDADSLNKTATGISLLLSASQQRQELMVRLFAESFKRLFKLMLEITRRHQVKPRVIRLRDEWVTVDPRTWNAPMDATISVGLGSGNKEQVIGALLNIHQLQTEAMQIQGGAEGALVGMEELHNVYSRIVENSGFQNPDAFFKDPGDTESQTIQQLQEALQQVQQQLQGLVGQQGQQGQPAQPQQSAQPQGAEGIPPEALAQAEQELMAEAGGIV